jgi:hypothetical protein
MTRLAPFRKALFFFLLITAASLLLSIDESMGAEDMVVAVDKSTLLKAVGLGVLALLGEIWRGQRSLYKITTSQGQEIKLLKGFCAGKNKGCGNDGDGGDDDET